MKAYEMMVTVRPERIKEARKARGLSQAAAAREAGITSAYLCLLEKGRQQAATNTVAAAIAAALGEEPEYIFGGYEPPKPQPRKPELSEAERNRLAEENIGWVKAIAWEQKQYFGHDLEEAFSFSLVCFAEAINSYDGTGNIRTNIARTIKSRVVSEVRKQTAAKRPRIALSLDAPTSEDSKSPSEYYNFFASPFNIENHVILREECREAVKALSPEQRRDSYIQELMERVGL